MFALLQRQAEAFIWDPRYDRSPGLVRLGMRILRFIYAIVRDAMQGQLTLRAMSLVYTTLLSIVPLIALSFSVLKGFGVHEQVEPVLKEILEPLGDKGDEITTNIVAFVDNVQVGVLGAVGLGFLVFTVISLVQKIEDSFNYVWQVEEPRSFAQRFSEYLSVMLVGPVLMFVALGMIASISNNELVQQISSIEPFGSTIILMGRLTPFVIVVLVFTFVYGFVPNTRVRLGSAFTGGITAGVVWALTGKAFASFVASSSNYTAIYSSFAIMILALIWLYINWLILMFGAQISFYHQNPLMLRTGRSLVAMANRERERLALQLMYLVGQDFLDGNPGWSARTLADEMGVPGNAISPVLRSLTSAGLLIHTSDEKLVPGRDLAAIKLTDILGAIRNGDDKPLDLRPPPQVDAIIDEVESKVSEVLLDRSLRALLTEPPPGAEDQNAPS